MQKISQNSCKIMITTMLSIEWSESCNGSGKKGMDYGLSHGPGSQKTNVQS